MSDKGHLYRDGAERRELADFKRRYGKRRGRDIYFAVVGKVKRERHAARSRRGR